MFFSYFISTTRDQDTWKENLHVSWSRVVDMKYEKNILNISENDTTLHEFVCLDEKEAKYLLQQLKETHTYQSNIAVTEKQKSKKNSIGVLTSSEEEKPKARTSRTSFSMLLFPNRQSK